MSNTAPQDASKQSQQPKPWDEFLTTMVWAVVIAVAFRSLLFEPFHIPSGSMKSNLLIGDYLFVSKFSYGYSRYSFPFALPLFEGRVAGSDTPERGDIVVFRPPARPYMDYIKRVIGLPGDRIEMRDGVLHINGQVIAQEYYDMFLDDDGVENSGKMISRFIETLPDGQKVQILKESKLGYANNTGIYQVPEGHYFMMGDNRDNSRDSRFYNEIGPVPLENIVGRADMIFFSVKPEHGMLEFWHWPSSLRFDRFFKVIE